MVGERCTIYRSTGADEHPADRPMRSINAVGKTVQHGLCPDSARRCRWRTCCRRPVLRLGCYQWLQVPAEVFENFLFARLDFKKDWFGQPRVVLARMNPACFQEHPPQVADALLSQQHLIVGLNHRSSSSTIPRFLKFLEV